MKNELKLQKHVFCFDLLFKLNLISISTAEFFKRQNIKLLFFKINYFSSIIFPKKKIKTIIFNLINSKFLILFLYLSLEKNMHSNIMIKNMILHNLFT